MKLFALAVLMFSASAFAQGNGCTRYSNNQVFMKAIETVAQEIGYSYEDMCSGSRVLDVHVTTKKIYNEQQEPIPHVWVSLHYNEYSCQYFVRESDFTITKGNCYNTW